MHQSGGEMAERLILGQERQPGAQEVWDELLGGLHRALGPTVLLAFDGGHLGGNLRRTDHLG